MIRYLQKDVRDDLSEKMVFVGGPRQVGKTTLALQLLGGAGERHPAYLNWDDVRTRRMLLEGALPADEPLVVFDEIHKYKHWRNLVKGFYDLNKSTREFLVTGSARLDFYRRGGDSLQGRYHYYRLHPLSLHEIGADAGRAELEALLRFGGFPEPYLKGSERHWKRWQRGRQSRVIHEDLVNLEQVKDVSQLSLLADILPEKVGSPLSINNLRGDLSVAFETADRWVGILENLYYCFRIGPYGLPRLRAAKKEKKLYLWDWSLCVDSAARFENLIASNLLKYCHHLEDTTGDRMELMYIRDSQKREIDFVVARERKPLFGVECKSGDRSLSRNISYFAERTSIPVFYQVHLGKTDREYAASRARVLPCQSFCRILQV
jgi:uncharacterized protein